MCDDRYERRRRDADETREMWPEFARADPVRDPGPRDEVSEPEPTGAREPVASPKR